MRDEIKSLKATIDELKKEREQYKSSRGLHKRIIDLEKQITELEQHSRRQGMCGACWSPWKHQGSDLEEVVVEAFKVAGVKVKKQDFHAVHHIAACK